MMAAFADLTIKGIISCIGSDDTIRSCYPILSASWKIAEVTVRTVLQNC
jgi:predicted amidohydrolase YtcJ